MKQHDKRNRDARNGAKTRELTSSDLKVVVGGGISTSPSPRD